MAIDAYGAKITRRDVTELAQSSEQLAVVSNMIRSSGVKWGEVAVNLLIVANSTVVRIQNKGAAAFARYLAKHPLQSPEVTPADLIPGADANPAPKSISDEDEE